MPQLKLPPTCPHTCDIWYVYVLHEVCALYVCANRQISEYVVCLVGATYIPENTVMLVL